MTPEFLQFLNKLLIPLDVHLKQRTPLLAKVGESEKVESKIYIYLQKEEDSPIESDGWIGRYVIVEPCDTVPGHFRHSFMESVQGIKTDYGPSVSANTFGDVLVSMIADYLIDGIVPEIATSKQ